jgi:hypothetical protein
MTSVLCELQSEIAHILDMMESSGDRSSRLLASCHSQNQVSARNLLDYLIFCSEDRSELQSGLAAIGLSSLGRSEAECVMLNKGPYMHTVIRILITMDAQQFKRSARLPALKLKNVTTPSSKDIATSHKNSQSSIITV